MIVRTYNPENGTTGIYGKGEWSNKIDMNEITALFDMFLYAKGYENEKVKARKFLYIKRYKVILYLRRKL
jgi:hypothetical protein